MYQKGKCVFFTGIQNKECKAGLRYADVRKHCACHPPGLLPCLYGNREGHPCDRFQEPTEEQVAESHKEAMDVMNSLLAGKSACCGAALDESRVLRGGRRDGHGPRYCSKCHKLAYVV